MWRSGGKAPRILKFHICLNRLNRWIGGPSRDSEEKNPCSCRKSNSDYAVCSQSNTVLIELCDDEDDNGDNSNEVFLFIKIRAGSEERACEKCGLTQTRKSTCRDHIQKVTIANKKINSVAFLLCYVGAY